MSEGTLTPDIIHDLHEDLETSSEFSCDTEGYYTSFHVDSGLKTLKEEEISPGTPLHTTIALSNSSNSQNLTAENEYELFGKGSTSTTTSSAGTVCTTLMAAGSDRSLVNSPTVPERKSSLTKPNRNRASNGYSTNSGSDRSTNSSFTKSPFSSLRYNAMRSYAEKQVYNTSTTDISERSPSTVTITGNIGNHREITAVAEVHTETELESAKKSTGTSSPDSGHNTSSSPIEDSVSSAHGKNSLSEQDYSESSDLEGTDRIERIRYKTTINSSRIPSMCVITPTNSDDECENNNKANNVEPVVKYLVPSRPKLELPTYDKNKDIKNVETNKNSKPMQIKPLHPFNNLMCRLKGVLPNKLSSKKSPVTKDVNVIEDFYDSGDYVTIADVKNNNQKLNLNRGAYANNDIVKKNLRTVLSGKLPETEYVSLNELPNYINETKEYMDHGRDGNTTSPYEEIQCKGAKVTLDSDGQVIYSSDTLKRRKGAHTTFEPGPFVQEICPTTTIIQRENADVVKIADETDFPYVPSPCSSKPTSPQLGKMIIKAPSEPHGHVTTEFITFPPPKPSTIIAATPITSTYTSNTTSIAQHKMQDVPRIIEAITRSGAYVNINDAEGVSLSPTKHDNAVNEIASNGCDFVNSKFFTDYRHSSADNTSSIPQILVQNNYPKVNNATLNRYQAANLRGENIGGHHYSASNSVPSKFWTLPSRTTELPSRRLTKDHTYINTGYFSHGTGKNNQQYNINTNKEESFRISPIDPRTSAAFKSSTPTYKDNVINLNSKLLSPIKSTMTNEELYAVIHKSKKKLNIKESAERSESPAISTISLSPVNSETSFHNKVPQRYPETGYLGEAKNRTNAALLDRQNIPYNTPFIVSNVQKQETTCADRHGHVPQTSRLDFKKLLLQHNVKLNTLNIHNKSNKLSAVEQLRLSKEKAQLPATPPNNRSHINILDLSGSPKTYNVRKIIKVNNQPSSPGRANALIKEHKNSPKILLSPKSQWRFSSPRSDVLSTPIPEANNEDDNSNNSSGEKSNSGSEDVPIKTVPISTNQHFGARRNLIPITEQNLEEEHDNSDNFSQGIFPIETDLSKAQGRTRSEIMQAKRAQFFSSPPESSPPKLTSFRSPVSTHLTSIAKSDTIVEVEKKTPKSGKTSPTTGKTSPSTLETAL